MTGTDAGDADDLAFSIAVPALSRPADVEVTETHPDVIVLVEEAMRRAEEQPTTLSTEMYLEVLEEAVKGAERGTRERSHDGPM